MDKLAFTLAEITITIVIVAILAALALPNFAAHLERMRVREAISVLQSVRAAFREYEIDNGGPPGNNPNLLSVTIPAMEYFNNLNLTTASYSTQLTNCATAPCNEDNAYIAYVQRTGSNPYPVYIQADGSIVCGDAAGTYDTICGSLGLTIRIPH